MIESTFVIYYKFLAHSAGSEPETKRRKIRMNKYELALVVSAKIEDDARTATVEKAKEYITRAGGTVTEVEDWGKKKLAYEVQKMSEAYYYFIQFDAESNVPASVEQDVRIMDNVLRFLCVRKDEA
jgi:small subunit ribosomal protein S6